MKRVTVWWFGDNPSIAQQSSSSGLGGRWWHRTQIMVYVHCLFEQLGNFWRKLWQPPLGSDRSLVRVCPRMYRLDDVAGPAKIRRRTDNWGGSLQVLYRSKIPRFSKGTFCERKLKLRVGIKCSSVRSVALYVFYPSLDLEGSRAGQSSFSMPWFLWCLLGVLCYRMEHVRSAGNSKRMDSAV